MKDAINAEDAGYPQPPPNGILLVDDDDRVLKFVSRMLHSFGHDQVHAVNSTKEALRVWASRGASIWLVISDFVMPVMTGDTLVIHLLRQQPELRALFISGNDPSSLNSKVPLLHGKNFLQKPFSMDDLRQIIQKLAEAPATTLDPSLLKKEQAEAVPPV